MTQAILNEQEREQVGVSTFTAIPSYVFDAIESAIKAKLGSAPMPEAAWYRGCLGGIYSADSISKEGVPASGFHPIFTAEQLQQAYLQGAAAQLSAEPDWYFYESSGADIFVPYKSQAPERATALYTLKGQE